MPFQVASGWGLAPLSCSSRGTQPGPRRQRQGHGIALPIPKTAVQSTGGQTARLPHPRQPWRPACCPPLAPRTPAAGCASLPSLHCTAHSAGLLLFPFPSGAHHLILIKHAELMLLKSPPEGINIIPLISPSPLAAVHPPGCSLPLFQEEQNTVSENVTAIKYAQEGGKGGGNEDNEGCETSDAAAACCYRNPSSPPPSPQPHPHPSPYSPFKIPVGPRAPFVLGCWEEQDHRVLAVSSWGTCGLLALIFVFPAFPHPHPTTTPTTTHPYPGTSDWQQHPPVDLHSSPNYIINY